MPIPRCGLQKVVLSEQTTMPKRPLPVLNREDPTHDPLIGNVKVTQEDWLNLARDVLVNEGVAGIKILTLSARLDVSRSSFYWYFRNHADLLSALLTEWEARNTRTIVAHCEMPADGINAAVCNFFHGFTDRDQFDRGLDSAVRDWARRDDAVKALILNADRTRLIATTEMFARHGYAPDDADARARILYYMQIGYYEAVERETLAVRLARVPGFLKGFTGEDPSPELLAEFTAHAMANAEDAEP